jgi:hypothetical protein
VIQNTVALLISGGIFLASAEAGMLYSTLPSPLEVAPAVSWSYGAEATTEFGDLIQIDPSGGTSLVSASVLLSNFSYAAQFPQFEGLGYNVQVTLNLYNVGSLNSPGSMIASSTTNEFVPFRPAPNPDGCANKTAVDDPGNTGAPYLAGNGSCYSGSSVLANFTFNNVDLSGLPSNQLIYGVSYDASTGPAQGLNFGWTTLDPSMGTNPLPDTGYLNTTNAELYFDAGASGTEVFRLDQNYTVYSDCGTPEVPAACPSGHYSGAIQLSASDTSTPEPGTLPIAVLGLLGLGLGTFRRNCAAKSIDKER